MSQHFQPAMLSNQSGRRGGLPLHTGLRGGACVDVNDQVMAALQTLTNALGGTTSAAAAPTTTSNTTTTSN